MTSTLRVRSATHCTTPPPYETGLMSYETCLRIYSIYMELFQIMSR